MKCLSLNFNVKIFKGLIDLEVDNYFYISSELKSTSSIVSVWDHITAMMRQPLL